MAIYHCSIKVFSRSKGVSAVAKAAYRAAEVIRSDYDGNTYDYSRKRGIVYKEIMLPKHAPSEYTDRAVLWNAVEKSERNGNAQLAREIEVSLPVELTQEQNIDLVRDYVKRHFVEQGMCADVCVHDTGVGNPHAHILLTMRPINEDGSWGRKSKKEYILNECGERIRLFNGTFKTRKICSVDWNEPTKAEEWRSAWADAVNTALKNANIPLRVDHRSYKRQGSEEIPTIHMGGAATRMERKGIRTELGDRNREIGVTNQQLRQVRARIIKLEKWLSEEGTCTGISTLADVISEILQKQGQSGLTRLKTASQMLVFLKHNQINDMAGLEEKVKSMYRKLQSVRNELKPVERRLKTLDEHIRQAEIYRRYKGKKPRSESEEILYIAARKYINAHLNGHKLDINAWKREKDTLTSGRETLYRDYLAIKNETAKVEQIKRSIGNIIRENTPETKQQLHYDRE